MLGIRKNNMRDFWQPASKRRKYTMKAEASGARPADVVV
jgi:hypothetical protein